MNVSKPLFASVPREARFACTGLLVLGTITLFLLGLGALFLIAAGPPSNPEGALVLGLLLVYFFLLGAGGLCAAVLIARKQPLGKWLAWCVASLYLINKSL
jgi:hypothetical protein